MPECIFTVYVESTSGEGAFREAPAVTKVLVLARTENEATLTALEMVACRRTPVACEVDYSNF